jgi:hypothetical protein
MCFCLFEIPGKVIENFLFIIFTAEIFSHAYCILLSVSACFCICCHIAAFGSWVVGVSGVIASDFIIQFVFLMLNPVQRLSNTAEIARLIALSDVRISVIFLACTVEVTLLCLSSQSMIIHISPYIELCLMCSQILRS